MEPHTLWLPSFVFRRKKFLQVWIKLRVITSWENLYQSIYLRGIIPLMYTKVLIYQTCLFIPFLSFNSTCFMYSWGIDTHFSTVVWPRNIKMTLRTSFWRICGIQGLAKRQLWKKFNYGRLPFCGSSHIYAYIFMP